MHAVDWCPLTKPGATIVAPALAYASRLRFPWLFGITLALFVLDLAIPDFVPFVDEILLGLLALLLGSLRRKRPTKLPETSTPKQDTPDT